MCIRDRIKKGQKVTWSAGLTPDAGPALFTSHPLQALGGDTPNPVSTGLDEATGEVTFPAAGTFGFTCGVHFSMTGVIMVVE